jgi:flagellar hook-length control protein FliK
VPTVAVPAVALPPVIVAPPAVTPSAPTTAADTAPNVTSDKTAIAATAALNAQVQAQTPGAADGNGGAAPGDKGTNPPSIAAAPNPSTANKASIANKALNAKQDPSAGAATPQAAEPEGASEAATGTQPTSPASAQPESPAGPNVKSAPAPSRAGRVANPDAPKPDEPTAAGIDATINATGDKPADPIQTVALQRPTDRTAAPTAVTSAAPTPTATAANLPATAVPVAGLAVAIASQAQAGRNRFEIRLDPPELGRVDVRLDVDRDGRVTSRLVADRPETLDLLRRDAPELQRALQDAGLKTSDSGLQFLAARPGFRGAKPGYRQPPRRRRPTGRSGPGHGQHHRHCAGKLWPHAAARRRHRHPRLRRIGRMGCTQPIPGHQHVNEFVRRVMPSARLLAPIRGIGPIARLCLGKS